MDSRRESRSEKRTFYQRHVEPADAASLMGVQAVVASPFFDGSGEVAGALYGVRLIRPRSGELGAMVAHVVQLVAAAIEAGLWRMEQGAEADRLRLAKEAAELESRTAGSILATIDREMRLPLATIIGRGHDENLKAVHAQPCVPHLRRAVITASSALPSAQVTGIVTVWKRMDKTKGE